MVKLAPGTVVGTQLRLVEPLGRGGMGRVWTAEHLGLGALCAVKFVAPERLEADPALRERLRREARVAAQLTSVHATRIYDVGETEDGTPFIVMERLSGETLAARLARTPRMAPREVALMISQIAGVLAAAHALGVVHRDIKPENLFLVDHDPGVFVKVLDFGVAKELRAEDAPSLTSTNAMIGTPQYMAPEQLLGSTTLDERCDVWSLGIVAYHALLGRRPFDGVTTAALSIAICGGAFKAVSEIDPELPRELDAWFARSLCVPAELRFGSVREQADAFVKSLGVPEDSSTLGSAPAALDSAPSPSSAAMLSTMETGETADREGSRDRFAAPSTLGGTASRTAFTGRPRAMIVRGTIGLALAATALWFVVHRTPSDVSALAASATPAPIAAAPPSPADASSAIASSTIDEARPIAAIPSPSHSAVALAAPSAAKRPRATVSPASSALAAPRARPAYCETDEGFAVDSSGHLRPRPECL